MPKTLFILILTLCFLFVLTRLTLVSTSKTEIYFKADVKDEFEIKKMVERKTGEKERRVVVGILA
jgi:hypothetical protein